DAVTIVRGVTTNVLWEDLWNQTQQSLTRGQTFSDVVLESRLIPPSIGQMIAAGERTGRLPEVFARIALTTEEELDEAIKNGTQLIEPMMIMFMGVTVGGIAIALLLPIFTIANVMAH
ncbi:MAG: type II secretion system F family protein, partial [Phycisphaerales bacterium]|nr:type II secretion system F family protein [Phycisphaerales bacterium]